MARILIYATHGSDDPTRATLPFFFASGAVEKGHPPSIILAGDAAILAHQGIAGQVQGVGLPPLKQLIAFAVEHQVPIYV